MKTFAALLVIMWVAAAESVAQLPVVSVTADFASGGVPDAQFHLTVGQYNVPIIRLVPLNGTVPFTATGLVWYMSFAESESSTNLITIGPGIASLNRVDFIPEANTFAQAVDMWYCTFTCADTNGAPVSFANGRITIQRAPATFVGNTYLGPPTGSGPINWDLLFPYYGTWPLYAGSNMTIVGSTTGVVLHSSIDTNDSTAVVQAGTNVSVVVTTNGPVITYVVSVTEYTNAYNLALGTNVPPAWTNQPSLVVLSNNLSAATSIITVLQGATGSYYLVSNPSNFISSATASGMVVAYAYPLASGIAASNMALLASNQSALALAWAQAGSNLAASLSALTWITNEHKRAWGYSSIYRDQDWSAYFPTTNDMATLAMKVQNLGYGNYARYGFIDLWELQTGVSGIHFRIEPYRGFSVFGATNGLRYTSVSGEGTARFITEKDAPYIAREASFRVVSNRLVVVEAYTNQTVLALAWAQAASNLAASALFTNSVAWTGLVGQVSVAQSTASAALTTGALAYATATNAFARAIAWSNAHHIRITALETNTLTPAAAAAMYVTTGTYASGIATLNTQKLDVAAAAVMYTTTGATAALRADLNTASNALRLSIGQMNTNSILRDAAISNMLFEVYAYASNMAASSWSLHPATTNINVSGHRITNVNRIVLNVTTTSVADVGSLYVVHTFGGRTNVLMYSDGITPLQRVIRQVDMAAYLTVASYQSDKLTQLARFGGFAAPASNTDFGYQGQMFVTNGYFVAFDPGQNLWGYVKLTFTNAPWTSPP